MQKTEKEKMLDGELYNARDPELLDMYHRARKLLLAFNATDSTHTAEKQRILSALLAKVDEDVWIEAPFFCDYGAHISIGKNSFVNMNCMFLDNNWITIGENVLIAPYVQLYTAVHPLSASERIKVIPGKAPYLTSSKPITVGDNVWIGGNTVILPGVTIGSNVTIGAGSVVTKNILDNQLAFGNPCKIIREIEA